MVRHYQELPLLAQLNEAPNGSGGRIECGDCDPVRVIHFALGLRRHRRESKDNTILGIHALLTAQLSEGCFVETRGLCTTAFEGGRKSISDPVRFQALLIDVHEEAVILFWSVFLIKFLAGGEMHVRPFAWLLNEPGCFLS